jgi:succinoglycan biosynthesis transport protein ExoP
LSVLGLSPTECELPLTFQEFLSSLWRRKLTILVSVIVAVVAALAYSKLQTPTYQSTALIQEATTSGSGTSASAVNLPDPVTELSSTAVEQRAAKLLGQPISSIVDADVTGTADATTAQVSVSATDKDPAQAQAVAQAYAQAYVAEIQSIVQKQIDNLTNEKNNVTAQISALGNATGNPAVQGEVQGLETTISSIVNQISTIQAQGSYATIVDSAGLPTTPTGLGKSKLVAIGLLAGLLVGCGIALGRDQFDTRLRTNPDIESITDAPILAELPTDSDVRTGKVAISMVQAPQSQMAEAVRELRTSLRVILDDTPCPILVVTSPQPGDGKTFVTANLAAAWAMSGSKVIVVSADFRRPRLEEIFGLETGLPGLADLIKSNWKNPEIDGRSMGPRGPGARPVPAREREPHGEPDQGSVSSFLVDSGIWGLQVLPAGTQLENPSELFGSPGMQPVLDQLPLLADVVLLDTPPVLAVPDTAILGSMAHGAMVVASEGKTDRVDLERTIRRLEATHCRVLGVAINRVRRSAADSYQAYSYKQ